jgi:hypothetical protein
MNASNKLTSLFWIIASTIGANIGASQAVQRFPEAGFARNPTGQFGWYLVGFSLTVGLAIAIAQLLVLAVALKSNPLRWTLVLVFWIPCTSVGIAAMMLPLWWWDASILTGVPWVAPVPLLPGAALLALMQKLLLGEWAGEGLQWVARSLVGLVIGTLFGLVLAMNYPNTIETVWATITIFIMAIAQGSILMRTLPPGDQGPI